MAEIEFKRRGTPLWVVVLALIVIALVAWFFVRRAAAPAAPATPTPATAPATPATGAATPAPAAATPLAAYSAFVDSLPKRGGDAAVVVSDGLRLLAGALQQQYPNNGVQVNLVRAMADSLRLPGVTPRRQADMAQAAFFATAFAMGRGGAGDTVNVAAAQVLLDKSLSQQMPAVRRAFEAASRTLKAPPQPAKPAVPPGAPPVPKSAAVPAAKS